MTTRTVLTGILGLALFGLTTVAAGCSDDSGDRLSSGELKTLCHDSCAKAAQCELEQNQADCEADCNSTAKHMYADFVKDVVACQTSHTCEELEQDACKDAGRSECKSDDTKALNAYCGKMVECNPDMGMTTEQCVNQVRQSGDGWIFKCFIQSDLDAYASCVDKAKCETAEADMQSCAERHLGASMD